MILIAEQVDYSRVIKALQSFVFLPRLQTPFSHAISFVRGDQFAKTFLFLRTFPIVFSE
jgi:hypothetical protein